MTLTLRHALPTDLDAVMHLETAGFPAGIVEEVAVFAHRIATFPQGFLLAELDSTPCGYFCTELWRDWNLDDPTRFDLGHDLRRWLDRDGEILYLASMTVAPALRGRGLGRDLFRSGMQRMGQLFPQLREAVLIVNEHWLDARQIYRSEGFRESAILANFFNPLDSRPGNAIVMTRTLPL